MHPCFSWGRDGHIIFFARQDGPSRQALPNDDVPSNGPALPQPSNPQPPPPPHTAMPPSPPGRSEAGRRQARRLGQPTPDPLRLPCDPQPSIGVGLSGPAAGWHRSLVPHLIPLPCPFANAPRSVLSSRTLIAGPVFLFQIRQWKFRVQPGHHIFGGPTSHGEISFHKNEKKWRWAERRPPQVTFLEL